MIQATQKGNTKVNYRALQYTSTVPHEPKRLQYMLIRGTIRFVSISISFYQKMSNGLAFYVIIVITYVTFTRTRSFFISNRKHKAHYTFQALLAEVHNIENGKLCSVQVVGV